eukprot:TRINITY_DN5229_c0_g1_i1.p1 TRINITY_DN5229_c0_g1~~TRINITY_DN5229_c0_g1_i1.p1  ORF type:complete len:488 (+),score=99.17 TRINITY_DN5229_c0_g1_i1:164-1627(+)
MASQPKIQQLFTDASSASDVSATSLPSITTRPNSAARSSTLTSTTRALSLSHNKASAARQAAKADAPLTPAQAIEKYSRYLTSYEEAEILDYHHIYFLGQNAKKIHASATKGPNDGYDDDKGRYKCIKHDHLCYRYEILKGLGKGSFGDVVKAYDHKTKEPRAVKIIRNERRFHKQAQVEVKVLELLKKNDRRNNHNLIHIREWFVFRNHLCIAFDLLGQDLYSALKKDGFKGFTLSQVQRFSVSLLACLRLLRRQRVIHCDLKPENILLTDKRGDDIKVIDFGSACLDHQKVHTYIQSRFYRAPEVILGLGYTMAIDMWSLGCILVELYNGHPIFPGRDEKEQLMYQCEVLGVPPSGLLDVAKRTNNFFDSNRQLRVTVDRKGRTHLPNTKSLSKAVGSDDELFLDFLAGCFRWDPSERMTPKEASRHPWVSASARAAAAASVRPTASSASMRMSTSSTSMQATGPSAGAAPTVVKLAADSTAGSS